MNTIISGNMGQTWNSNSITGSGKIASNETEPAAAPTDKVDIGRANSQKPEEQLNILEKGAVYLINKLDADHENGWKKTIPILALAGTGLAASGGIMLGLPVASSIIYGTVAGVFSAVFTAEGPLDRIVHNSRR